MRSLILDSYLFLMSNGIFALQCYASADSPGQCRIQADDYLECLHRTQEVRVSNPWAFGIHRHTRAQSIVIVMCSRSHAQRR